MNTTDTRIQAQADQLAAVLRDRRPLGHSDQPCDALAPCDECRVTRRRVAEARKVALIPEQRDPQ